MIVIHVWHDGRKYLAYEHDSIYCPYFRGPDYLPCPDRSVVLDAPGRGETGAGPPGKRPRVRFTRGLFVGREK